MIEITSVQNPQIKNLVKLRDRRDRDEQKLILIEGYRELRRAIDAGWSIRTVYHCPELFLGMHERDLIEQSGAQSVRCSRIVFEKISYRDRPDGLLGVGEQRKKNLSELRFKNEISPFLVVAESIEKPGNLGTILRSCDAAGVDGVIVCDPTTDVYNPNVVRSSVGTLFTVPVVEETAHTTLSFLRQQKIQIVAASPHAQAVYTHVDLTQPIAIAVGTEQYGLSDEWMQNADLQVRIPMLGIADSLNVASATTLLLYEVLRQRHLLR